MKPEPARRSSFRSSMFPRLVARALLLRRRRMSVALVALVVGATLASALLTTYADLEKKMSGELRGFGANLVVAPASNSSDATLDVGAGLALPPDLQGLATLPFLYVVGQVNGEPAVLAGTRFERLGAFARAWHWQGRKPKALAEGSAEKMPESECAVGGRLAAHFRVAPGSRLKAAYQGDAIELQVTAVVTTGASEDHQLLLPLETLQKLAGLPGRISLLQVIAPGTGAEVEAARARLAAIYWGGAEVRLLRPVAESSARVLLKVKWMLFAVTGLVLGIIGLCVMTTLSAIVLERRKDIAVMKALGGSQRRITALFLSEAAALALPAGAAGYAAGLLLARWLGQAIFRAPVALRPVVLPEVVLVTLLVALLATLFPLRIVRAVEPAAILKGE